MIDPQEFIAAGFTEAQAATLVRVLERVDRTGAQRFGLLQEAVNDGFVRKQLQFDRLNEGFERLNQQVERMGAFVGRLADVVTEGLRQQERALAQVDHRLTRMEGRLDAIEARLDDIEGYLRRPRPELNVRPRDPVHAQQGHLWRRPTLKNE